MTNSWSLLYDELNMSENSEDLYLSGIAGFNSPDTIRFTSCEEIPIGAAQDVPITYFVGEGQDHLTLKLYLEEEQLPVPELR